MYHLKYLTIMSLNYSIAMMGNPLKKRNPKKAYAKAQTNGELSLKELSTLIASKCTVHQADVSAVLIATTECMLEGLKAGKQVNSAIWVPSASRSIPGERQVPTCSPPTISRG